MAPQATRISIVFGCLIFAFVGIRSVTVPESFGKQGHWRFTSLADISKHEAKFEGKQACIDCHANNTPHTAKGVSCETCHGPGAAHTKEFDTSKVVVNNTRAFCGTCHAMNAARRASFPQVDMTDHHPAQRCTECHKIHPEDAPTAAAGTKPGTVPKADASAKPTTEVLSKAAEPTKPGVKK